MKRWTGVATCEAIDLMRFFGPVFAEVAPEITLLRPAEV